MTTPHRASRRTFLKQAAAVGFTAPFFIRNLRAASPNEVVRHASFGASGMAGADWKAIVGQQGVQFICVAEVDSSRTGDVTKQFSDGSVTIYRDWREMLDKEHKRLDTVNVGTPDHMHGPMAMSAMQLGLHVYCQKPLTHDVYESRRLTEFARENKLVSQMGIQVHSSYEYRAAVELVQSGAIGKVKEVHTWSNKKWGDPSPLPEREDSAPDSLDWDLWLGVAQKRTFIGGGYYHPGNWRKRIDFGTGTFGDMGCHIYDPVFKALALTAPITVRSTGPKPSQHNWANDAVVHYEFPGTKFTAGDTVKVTWYDGDQRPPQEAIAQLGGIEAPGQGSIFLGTEGVMLLPHVARPILLPKEKYEGFKMPELPGVNHWGQFVEAVRGNGTTSAGFDYSGPLTEAVLLGGVASRFPDERLEWDAAELTFGNQSAADQYIRRAYRSGWEVKGLG